MSSIEIIKQELETQKTLIESKGGTVVVAANNPSPSEITAGIESIEMPDVSLTTATEADVLAGKTFYSQDYSLKTGVLQKLLKDEDLTTLFAYETEQTSTQSVYYSFPESCTYVRSYLFYQNPNPCVIRLSPNTITIAEYAFAESLNFTIENINDLPYLYEIKTGGLRNTKGINMEEMWPSLKIVESYALSNCVPNNSCINLPALKTIGSYSFTEISIKKFLTGIDFSKITASYIGDDSFMNLVVDNDLFLPACVNTLGSYCFHRGSFNNATIPATVKKVSDYVFGGSTTDPLDTYNLKTLTFESVTPPTIGTTIVSTNHVQKGCKIYVPDESVDTYKALSKMSKYADIILPISEKP